MSPLSSGRRDKWLVIQNPNGAPIANGDGEYTQPYIGIAELFGSVEPVTAVSLERVGGNTVFALASHIVTIPFISAISTESRVVFKSRTFEVAGFANPLERDIELILACKEIAVPTTGDTDPPSPGSSWTQSGWMQE
jgi:head-tail adaptor